MVKKKRGALPKCKACGFPMILDETLVQGRGDTVIKRTFLHCVNGQCGHIDRVGEKIVEPSAT
jgi:hypothetical protein